MLCYGTTVMMIAYFQVKPLSGKTNEFVLLFNSFKEIIITEELELYSIYIVSSCILFVLLHDNNNT